MTEESRETKELPKGWIKVNLNNLVFPNRPRVSPQKYPNFPFIGMEHVSPQTMKLLGTDIAKNMKSNAVHFYSHDVLYGRLRPYLNKVYKPDFEGLCSSEFIVFPETECLSSKYLQYLLNSAKFVSFSSHLNEGERPRVDFNTIGNYEFLLPPLNEQNRIVEKIEELFSDIEQGIESLKTAQKQLKVYRQAVLKWAFEGKLTEKWRSQIQQEKLDIKTGEELLAQIKAERENRYQQKLAEWEEAVSEWEAIGKIGKRPTKPSKLKDVLPLTETELAEFPQLPESWIYVAVDILLTSNKKGMTTGPFGTMLKKSDYKEKGISVLGIENIGDGVFIPRNKMFISEEKAKELVSFEVSGGDIIISRSGTVGEICCVPERIGLSLISTNLMRLSLDQTVTNSKFFVYLFQGGGTVKEQIKELCKGSTRDFLNQNILKSIKFPLPSLKEQDQIVQELESRFSICDQLEATIIENLQKAEALRQSILKRAFEGKLVPQDPNDEPAEKLLERIKQEKIKVKKGEQLSIQSI